MKDWFVCSANQHNMGLGPPNSQTHWCNEGTLESRKSHVPLIFSSLANRFLCGNGNGNEPAVYYRCDDASPPITPPPPPPSTPPSTPPVACGQLLDDGELCGPVA